MPYSAFHSTVAQILDGSFTPINSADEAAYLEEWTKAAAPLTTPLALAIAGGAIADRLAWVFIAGYQAANRRVFPELPMDGWVAYLASEDRKGEFPGVTAEARDGGFVLSGHKTWLAASDHAQHLVISVGERDERRCFFVDRDTEGVSIFTYDRASYLGDMSQGRATFEGVAVAPSNVVTDHVFGNSEPLYVLTAAASSILSHSHSRGGPLALEGRALAAIAAAASLSEIDPTDSQVTLGLVGVAADVDAVATEFEAFLADTDEALLGRWSTDRRLITMFTAGLERRAGA
jgi:hypothetical protein